MFAFGEMLRKEGTFDVGIMCSYFPFAMHDGSGLMLPRYCNLTGNCDFKQMTEKLARLMLSIKFFLRCA